MGRRPCRRGPVLKEPTLRVVVTHDTRSDGCSADALPSAPIPSGPHLQLSKHVGGLAGVEGAAANEENVIRIHVAVLGGYRGACQGGQGCGEGAGWGGVAVSDLEAGGLRHTAMPCSAWPLLAALVPTNPRPLPVTPAPSPPSPSMMGSRSRCTPSALASPPYRCSVDVTILSISSMNTMPAVLGGWAGSDKQWTLACERV